MANTKLSHGAERKWDWDFLRTLYLSGMDPTAIRALPEFKGLSEHYLNNRVYKFGWSKERQRLRLAQAGSMGMSFEQRMTRAKEAHYHFILKELEQERAIYEQRSKTTGIKDQAFRLDVLKQLEEMARKALGLDDEKPADRAKQGFNMMIAMANQGGKAIVKIEGSPASENDGSAMSVLLSNQNDSRGILEQRTPKPVTSAGIVNDSRASKDANNLHLEGLVENFRNDPERHSRNGKEPATVQKAQGSVKDNKATSKPAPKRAALLKKAQKNPTPENPE